MLTLRKNDIDYIELKKAIWKKAGERNSSLFIENHERHLNDIRYSRDILEIWNGYCKKYNYAQGIELESILNLIENIFTVE